MKIIPVLDIQQGQVVHGIAGKRSEYEPIQSIFTSSAMPIQVAQAFQTEFGLTGFYLADLDALAGKRPNYELFERLTEQGFHLQIDAGIQTDPTLLQLSQIGDHELIIASETLTSADFLQRALTICNPEKLLFSIDLKNGVPQVQIPEWQSFTALQIFETVWNLGYRQFIILDVAAVGTGQGVPTIELCQQIHQSAPEATLITGGGIRTEQDLTAMAQQNSIAGLLIASALHNGALTPKAIQKIHSPTHCR